MAIHGKQIKDESVSLSKITKDGIQSILFDQNVQIGMLKEPILETDLANKKYVDGLAAGLDAKESVRFSTSGDIGGVYNSAGGTGSTGSFSSVNLTTNINIDYGIETPVIGDRLLIKNQTDPKQNGIYIILSLGTNANIERSLDHNTNQKVSSGNYTFIENGIEALKGYVLQGDGNLSLNIDPLNWVIFSQASAYTGGNGINVNGSIISSDVDNTSVGISNTNKIEVKDLGITSAKINTGAVTSNKILDSNITTVKINDLAVTGVKIANNAITNTKINSNVLGNGLTGGSGTNISLKLDTNSGLNSVSNGLSIKLDGTSITKTVNGISVNTSGITNTLAGKGLVSNNTKLDIDLANESGLNFTATTEKLEVVVDDSTIGKATTTGNLFVKDNGITTNKILNDAITVNKILNDAITSAKINSSAISNGLSGGSGTSLTVKPDITTGGNIIPVSVSVNGVGIDKTVIVSVSDLASNTNGKGASTVGIEDVNNNFTSTDVEGALDEIAFAIANADGSVPTKANKSMQALVVTTNEQLACSTGISVTPPLDSYVQVFINGIKVSVGDSSKALDCYFSDDGTSARSIENIEIGDKLYWNAVISGYPLDTTDIIDFDFVS